MSFFSNKIGSKKGIWKWEVFFTLGLIWSAPGRSIYHYLNIEVRSRTFGAVEKISRYD